MAKKPTRKDKQLKSQIEKYLEYLQLDGVWDVRDSGVWLCDHPSNKYKCPAVLHFDGAGYYCFSGEHNIEPNEHIKKLEEIAKSLGYEMQDHNSWSIGFYRD